LPPAGCDDSDGSGDAREDGHGDGNDVIVIGAPSLADADECNDRKILDHRVGIIVAPCCVQCVHHF
jgi:hypothetical protein